MDRCTVLWEGDFFSCHSLAHVNRELVSALLDRPEIAVYTRIHDAPRADGCCADRFAALSGRARPESVVPDIHVRCSYPPRFGRNYRCKTVLYQPWEYGPVPVDWVAGCRESVDIVWTPSAFTAKGFIESGITASRVHVVPHGIHPALFRPRQDSANDPEARPVYRFLYVGGVNTRKGTDILVNAYLSEFGADEPVELFIKDVPFYQSPVAQQVRQLAQRNDIASIRYTQQPMHPDALPALFQGADCYVHPYRAEGFALPVLEALACGLPVLVTGAGPVPEYASSTLCRYLPAVREYFPHDRANDMDIAGRPYWHIPDMHHLQREMRSSYENRRMYREMGAVAAARVRRTHPWENAAHTVVTLCREMGEG